MSDTMAIPGLAGARRLGAVAALAGAGVSVLGATMARGAFFEAYLLAFLFWIGLALGCLGLLMLHHLVGGRWGFACQRVLEAGASTLPLFIPLLLPVLWGMEHLFPWATAAAAADHVLVHKAPYLNVRFFVIRAGAFMALWSLMAYALLRWSRRQDASGDTGSTRRMQVLSGPGLVAFVITTSFAHFDWVMSLEPHWFSTIVGLFFLVSMALTALCFVILTLLWVRHSEALAPIATPARFHDLARLLIAFVMLWAYLSFSQYLIIWMANLPEENFWYLHRAHGGWQHVTVVLVVFQFGLPFLLLKAQYTKKTAKLLGYIALALLLVRVVDLLWWTRPSEHHPELAFTWVDLGTLLGVGGLWFSWFSWQLGQAGLLPRHDPRLAESLSHGH